MKKTILFEIDELGKISVYPNQIGNNHEIEEELKFTAADLHKVNKCVFNILHNPTLYHITAKDFHGGPALEVDVESSLAKITDEDKDVKSTINFETEDGKSISLKKD